MAQLLHTRRIMSIVCILDSVGGSHVAVVSALLAQRMKTSCHLAQSTQELRESAAHRARAAWLSVRLTRRADRMRSLTSNVRTHVLPGPMEAQIAMLADRVNAELIVRGVDPEQLDMLAQKVRVPVLGVRNATPFVRWASDSRPLRVVAALSGGTDAPVVLRMVRRLADAAPCEVQLLHVSDREVASGGEAVHAILTREGVDPSWTLTIERRQGPRAPQIMRFASEYEADVIVTGSRVMTRVSRLWARSVSRQVLVEATCSVLCVPVGAPRQRRRLQSILAATDLRPSGDDAIALASRVVAPGGVVHLLHVLPRADARLEREARTRLEASAQALVTRGVSWQVHLRHGANLVATIERASQELAVDAVCIGSKGVADTSDGSKIVALMSQVGCALMIANPGGH